MPSRLHFVLLYGQVNNMTTFGLRLRFFRKRLALTQEELGKILNVSASTIGMYERGEREPAFKVLVHIAEYFETSIDYLLGHQTTAEKDSFPFLSTEEEELLSLKQEFPTLFQHIQNASPSEIEQFTKIIKVMSQK